MVSKPNVLLLCMMPVVALGCGAAGGDETPFDCGRWNPAGAIVIQGAAGVARNQGMTRATGDLVICEIETLVALPNLVSAESIRVVGRSPGEVSFPALAEAETISVTGGVKVTLPSLERVDALGVGESFNNTWNLELPRLTTARAVGFDAGHDGRLLLPLLEQASNIQTHGILEAPRLREVDTLRADLILEDGVDLLPALEMGIESISLELRGSATATATLPALRSVPALVIGDLNSAGRGLSLPALTSADRLIVNRMPELQSIDAPNLTSLMDLTVYENPRLTECEIDDLVAQTQPATMTIYDNGPACP